MLLSTGCLAMSLMLTVVSTPDGNCMCAYDGLACRRVAGDTGGSFLDFLVWFLTYIGPGLTQDGIDFPDVDLRVKLNMRSCGVVLVAVHSKDLIECSASGNTISQSESFKFRE